ncbi:4,5-dihydroxyphthalate decarboxylase [Paenochrobactrum gallinarii]|uniref:4,5-dihydroxyphthalate decarboxylase n=1 Tax=Paenochrobactrum gallinarii TaxID=643673 RepID=A0A841M0M6_9HYPH|nr:ABC transporter substrate-binding protein [Paenochrobactrum gallinarii]MBB6262580.1 4,5-dihydroxyphthalate decarboxylase [Paenochrobactrum gallinarii]
MAKVQLSIATWDYDRVRPLIDGRVKVEGCEITYLPMTVEECFQRAYLHGEFDVTELGFSPFLIGRSRGAMEYEAIPVFLSRMFRHSAIYIRKDRGILRPEDLRGKRVGVPEYQMSAALWARGMIQDDHGVRPDEMTWIQGGLEVPGRREKFPLNLPDSFPLEAAPAGRSLSKMLEDGELDAIFSARAPSCFSVHSPSIGRLFPDYKRAEMDYYRRCGVFPIMHALGLRKTLVERHPWLPVSLYKAFAAARDIAEQDLREVAALKTMLPWLGADLEQTEKVMGRNFWTYGVEANAKTLDLMFRYSYEQGLAVRLMTAEDVFIPSTLDDSIHV